MAARRSLPAGDPAIAAALTAVALFEISVSTGRYSVHGHLTVAVVAVLASCAALLWRRRAPVLVAAFALGVLTAAFLAGVVPQAWLVPYVLVLSYSVGAHAPGRRSGAGLGIVVALALTITVFAVEEPGQSAPSDYVFTVAVCGAAWLAGHALRRRHAQAAADHRAALAAERARIARELHDVVAHGLSVIAIQSDAAEQALAVDPRLAGEPLRAIRATAQESLGEMRRLVGLLRVDDSGPLQPQPGTRHLDALTEEVRAAGVRVDLDLTGEAAALPPGLDLVVYRIVQESLTNVCRHAGPAASVRVSARVGERDVLVEVVDDGVAAGQPSAGGHGLLGLRERVALYGGRFDAGPLPGGGFRVRASLPVPGSAR
ncbi:sensor histidine kinase [Actinoplanes sp. URMC 104]|uniref:sensor histidine kinase n=1 Tax=Actinoplanes sp. URMC 104 TaxID=3423409 RepID=UPI003F1A26D8